MDILQRIRDLYPTLTKKQRGIADYLLENPEDVCYVTLAQLSHQTSSSELTLLRFCKKAGCSSFLELKNEFREYTQHMIRLLSAPAYFPPENASSEGSDKADAFLFLPMISRKYSASFWRPGCGCSTSTPPSLIWRTWRRRRTGCSTLTRATLSSSFPSQSIIILWEALPKRRRTRASLS